LRRAQEGRPVFDWLLRLLGRKPRPAADEGAPLPPPTSAEGPQAIGAAPAAASTTTAVAGFEDVLAGADFDPAAAPVDEAEWTPPKPAFSLAARADIAATDPDEVATLAATITSELLASIDKVPPFPIVANRLIELSTRSDVRADVVERLVVQDAVIAAKVIGAANSPFYGLSSRVETVEHAIRVIGLREVTQTAMAAAAAAIFDMKERVAFESMVEQQQAAWAHSLAVARGSAWLAMWLGADVQRAYVAGLLHDIGKPVALRGIGFAMINGRRLEAPGAALAWAAVEAAHVDVGEMLADAWGLGDEAAQVIEQHHDDEPTAQLTRIIQLASAVDELRTNPAHPLDLLPRTRVMAKRLGLDKTKLGELADELSRASNLGLQTA
jgi:putative nucleotidyltransferase with HDIG domain